MPTMFCARSAATTPPAVPSLEATTASTLLLFFVRICSMFFCATSGAQPSVYCSPTILMSPLSIAGFEHFPLAAVAGSRRSDRSASP